MQTTLMSIVGNTFEAGSPDWIFDWDFLYFAGHADVYVY